MVPPNPKPLNLKPLNPKRTSNGPQNEIGNYSGPWSNQGTSLLALLRKLKPLNYLGFPKIRGTCLGVPLIRTVVYIGVYIGVYNLVLVKYYILFLGVDMVHCCLTTEHIPLGGSKCRCGSPHGGCFFRQRVSSIGPLRKV